MGLAMALVGAMVAAGIYGCIHFAIGVAVPITEAPRPRRTFVLAAHTDRLGLRLGCAAVALVITAVATGWPVLMVIGVVGGFFAPSLLTARARRDARASKLEAIASWTEQLRDMVSGASQLEEALVYTAPVAPPAIRGDVEWLVSALAGGMSPRTALRRFADRLDDPVGDKVVAAMILTLEGTVSKLSNLLTRLATSTRDEVRMRQRVDTSRAGTRTAFKGMVGFTIVFVTGLIVFARSYVDTYRTIEGQLMLVVVAAIFTTAFWWLARASRPVRPARFLIAGSAPSVGAGHHDDVLASRRVAWTEGPIRPGGAPAPSRWHR